MEQIIHSILLLVLLAVGAIFYFALMVTILPRIIKARSSLKESSDRGLKKYVYPEGRAISYEAHPSIRKYINGYILFTRNGYKYLKCNLDVSVERLVYSVVMFDRRGRVLDVLEVREKNISAEETEGVLLHQNTSYVSLVLESVNSESIEHEPIMCCEIKRLPVYAALVGLVSFVLMSITAELLTQYDDRWLQLGFMNSVNASDFLLPALCIGLVAGVWAFVNNRSKGIRWTR